jgi:MoxR-like ATPase
MFVSLAGKRKSTGKSSPLDPFTGTKTSKILGRITLQDSNIVAPHPPGVASLGDLGQIFERAKYVSDDQITMAIFLALKMERPLLIEGDPGCGKTEIAKVLSEGLNTRLIRLQCYEGLDANSTIYEWDYLRQLLTIRLEENRAPAEEIEKTIFSERFLLRRPLLAAILDSSDSPPVLLIDEIDRADEEFEGFLLELLAEFQVTVPELGTFRAKKRPIIIITSNRTRELGDGLRRRCLYLYMSYPNTEKELKIVELKVPGIKEKLARQVVEAVSKIRASEDLVRKPGTSEVLDWATALLTLGEEELNPKIARQTLSCVLKNSDELSRFSNEEYLSSIITSSSSSSSATSSS